MLTIIPAILTDDINILRKQLAEASKFARRVQIDFALAPFIDPSATYKPSEVERINFSGILEAHLMVSEPVKYFADVRRAGFDYVYFHLEAVDNPSLVIRVARAHGLKVGLAANPGTKWKKIKKSVLKELDAFMFMTVIPGKQGNPFQKRVFESIKEFSSRHPSVPLAVDGGVDEGNIGRIVKAGATLIAVGSGIWQGEGGPEAAYKRLEKIIA